ncbi:MAG: hypothetical protein U0Q15_15885 [Kineosporiaceae bacterium]
MNRTVEDCYEALEAAEELPWGAARTAVVEEVVAAAETLDDRDLAIDARLALVADYQHGGEPLKQLPVFSWLLARHDEEPFDEEQLFSLLWQYKAVAYDVVLHPGIPLPVVMSTLDDMARRFADAGEGQAPVLGVRYEVLAFVHGAAAAEDAYLAWVRAPRTELSDCAGCEPTSRVDHLVATGRYEDAVREAFAVLDADDGCENQPMSMIASSLEAMLRTGHAARAATEHLRGVRGTRRDVDGAYPWALHLDVLTRAGRLQRAADLMAERVHDLDSPPTPYAEMVLAATCAAVVSRLRDAGLGDRLIVPRRPSTLVPGPTPAAELVAPLREHALALAARFDERNGTEAIGTRVAALLDPEPLPDLPLDFLPDAAVAPRSGRRAAAPAETAPGGTAPLGDASTLAEFAEALEAARASGDRAARRRVLEVWARRRDTFVEQDDADQLAIARLDAAQAIDQAETDPGVLPATVQLPAWLRAAGDPAAATRFEFWQVNEAVQRGAVTPQDGLSTAEALLERAATELGPAGYAAACFLFLATGQTVAVADGGEPMAQAVRERAPEVVAAGLSCLDRVALDDLDAFERGCCASLLRIRAQMTADPTEERACLRRGLDLLPPGTRAGERALLALDLAAALDADGDVHAALALLAGAEADAVTAGDATLASRAAGSTASLLMRLLQEAAEAEETDGVTSPLDSAAAAVSAATRAVRHAEATGEPVALDQARRTLIHALRAADRLDEASETAELAVYEASRRLTDEGLAPATDLDEWPEGEVARRLDVHLAGALAWAAAICAEQLEEEPLAHAHARASAGWHVRNANPGAASEALEVAARTADEAQAAADLWASTARANRLAGDLWGAASALRSRVGAAAGAGGTQGGLLAVQEAHEAIDAALAETPDDADAAARAEWEHCVVAERAAQILARGEEFDDALAMTDGLAERYRRLGDLGSVWDVATLRCRILDAQGRLADGEGELRDAIEEAGEHAPDRAADMADLLSALLREAGRFADAKALRDRFGLD